MKRVAAIEVVEDRTADSSCTDGFLQLRRLRLANRYEDGTRSDPYACDVMTRRHTDAVAIALHARDGDDRVFVLLRDCLRPPVTLRAARDDLLHREERAFLHLPEIVAGVLEPGDAGPEGLLRRARIESAEEAGLDIPLEAIAALGAAFFPSPGVTDERVHLVAAPFDPDAPRTPTGDGSPMEDSGALHLLPLDEAIRRCRTGEIPDAKTEIALLRLCDLLGWSPHHGRSWDALATDARPPTGRIAWLGGRDVPTSPPDGR